MSTGIVMLAHTAFNRAAQVARHWSEKGCPVVIHVDNRVPENAFLKFTKALSDLSNVKFCARHACEWGTWGMVAATQSASEMMLAEFREVDHVLLTSGSCLPLRPVQELESFLKRHPDTDFIESATTEDVPWTVGGLDQERFTLRFPFSWKKHRWLFDRYVRLQRRVGFRRKTPNDLTPHMGSQWWCLTRHTLDAILNSPDRAEHDAYFRKVWIPDESYFQTLARVYARKIRSQSLTLAQFDYQGKPYIFYDDHLPLLKRSNCFIARKIWPASNTLYNTFLRKQSKGNSDVEPNPGRIARLFSNATERRIRGRAGLYMQSRFPRNTWDHHLTSAPYSVFEGFGDVFENFDSWLGKATGANVHGHLFDRDRVQFAGDQDCFCGAMSGNAAIRDYNPEGFLSSLIWNTRGERQCFQFGPADNQKISKQLATDPNARISVISGAWIIPLFKSGRSFGQIRTEAARLQKTESKHLDILRASWVKAQVRIWTLADFMEAPVENLQSIVDEMGAHLPHKPVPAIKVTELPGFREFLQDLRDQGMHPWLTGDFQAPTAPGKPTPREPRSYMAGK
ncbi:beta-1,6-N-acetylglucosaminyltransferase [Halocynthiibacter styelae]|uniref:Peptide O-xylosyltransferase n=1 Tax=Halocynthiibacter styelae TaxID=2761955 RepID=A0A8J7LKE5_9RHOB|nr:beta-1,6-N-acetylglucosaminyltransferase [Paenihalocynthiibacter styelae]MBI1493850.1 glycosyl transferase [Paenihalocynthiibacter styelae]